MNHPNHRWSVKPEDLYDIPDGTLLEIWNGQGHINNLGGGDGAGQAKSGEERSSDDRPSAEGFWDFLLSRAKRIWGVVASRGSADAPGGTEAPILLKNRPQPSQYLAKPVSSTAK